jgi:hypothetical protein
VSGGVLAVFLAVVGGRFVLPLFIPRWPLTAIIGCLLLDGVDQTIFQSFGYDPPGYQGYDKAMDVYYLAIAYLATMRNWQHLGAFRIGRFLYFYRLVGVVAFELLQLRALLLIFANTFEYFFIAYEGVRTRWSTLRFSLHWWLTAAALIWIFVKLPQEYWIHVAQLDLTDVLSENWWAPPLLVALLLVGAAVFWFLVRPRLLPPDWDWRVAADPLPEEMDTAAEQSAWYAKWGVIRTWSTVEKIVLVGLISIVYGEILPGAESTPFQLFVGVAVVVVVNTGFTLALARRSWTIASTGLAFLARVVANVVLVAAAEWALGREGGNLDGSTTLFFLTLISLITTLHDRYRPILATRVVAERATATEQP